MPFSQMMPLRRDSSGISVHTATRMASAVPCGAFCLVSRGSSNFHKSRANRKLTDPVSELTLDALAAVLIANEPKHGAECQSCGRKREHLLRIRG